ncbi:hypothetical protein FQZ97_962460 [compost metagenome]
MRGIEGAVDGDHRHAGRHQAQIGGVVLRQAAGDDQCIAAPRTEQFEQLPLAVRVVVRAGDQ